MPPDLGALLRVVPAFLLGLAAAFLFDRMCVARRLQPPGFRVPWRRLLAGVAVASLLGMGIFGPITVFSLGGGQAGPGPDLTQVRTHQLFGFHFLMLATMGIWFLLGFAGRDARPAPAAAPAALPPQGDVGEGLVPSQEAGASPAPTSPEAPSLPLAPPPVPLRRQLLAQFGLLAPSIPREIGIGAVLGLGAWVAVLLTLLGVAAVILAAGGEETLPKQPPAMVPFIAALPIGVRVLISLSAGVVEESFFRGFLQPRIGIPLSTAFFALAHLSYGQPFMLVGITLLSLIYAFIVRWRQNLWPAITAHALFDAVQLLVVVPSALRFIQGAGEKTAAALLGFL